MKKTIMVGWVLAAVAAVRAEPAAPKKYDVKSGVVTMETVMKVGNIEMKSNVVVSFDDYGARECKETYVNGNLEKVYFSDGKELYALQLKKKIAQKKGDAHQMGTELRVDPADMGTAKDRESGKVKQGAAMEIAGKTCETIDVAGPTGLTRYGGWNKVLVYLKTDTVTITATKIEENAAVPPSKFQVPEGFTVQ